MSRVPGSFSSCSAAPRTEASCRRLPWEPRGLQQAWRFSRVVARGCGRRKGIAPWTCSVHPGLGVALCCSTTCTRMSVLPLLKLHVPLPTSISPSPLLPPCTCTPASWLPSPPPFKPDFKQRGDSWEDSPPPAPFLFPKRFVLQGQGRAQVCRHPHSCSLPAAHRPPDSPCRSLTLHNHTLIK